ncbi:MAG: hypothetical protein ACK5WV_06025 [Chryseotalea sp.]
MNKESDQEKIKRITYQIPEDLIISKGDGREVKDFTIYDLIAHHASLTHCIRDIYKNQEGEYFILTKYGFEKSLRINLKQQIREYEKIIERLQQTINKANDKMEIYSQSIKILELKYIDVKEKLKIASKPLQEESGILKQEIKTLNQKLKEFKQVNTSVVNKLRRLIEDPALELPKANSDETELDWKDFNDLHENKNE